MQNCRRKAADKIVSTDRRMARQLDRQPWRFQYTPLPLRCGGITIIGKGIDRCQSIALTYFCGEVVAYNL